MDWRNGGRSPSPSPLRSPSPFRSPSPLMSPSNGNNALGLSPRSASPGPASGSAPGRAPPSYADSSLDRSPMSNPLMLDDRPRVPPPIYLRSSTVSACSLNGSMKINVPAWSVTSHITVWEHLLTYAQGCGASKTTGTIRGAPSRRWDDQWPSDRGYGPHGLPRGDDEGASAMYGHLRRGAERLSS